VSVLQNAFVGAFANSLEGSISLRDVKTELGRYDLAEGEQKGDKEQKKDKKDENEQQKRRAHGPRA
jgi:hypothetical protein